jgi:hypothetical protein
VTELGKTLVVLGLTLAGVGAGRGFLGRLPGDIHIKGERTEVYFPIATCLVISAVLSLVSWLLRSRH